MAFGTVHLLFAAAPGSAHQHPALWAAEVFVRSEVSAFIDEDAQFAHRVIPPDIRIAGNTPALDGPGSFDQPQSVS